MAAVAVRLILDERARIERLDLPVARRTNGPSTPSRLTKISSPTQLPMRHWRVQRPPHRAARRSPSHLIQQLRLPARSHQGWAFSGLL